MLRLRYGVSLALLFSPFKLLLRLGSISVRLPGAGGIYGFTRISGRLSGLRAGGRNRAL
jgi:hypothetical protein